MRADSPARFPTPPRAWPRSAGSRTSRGGGSGWRGGDPGCLPTRPPTSPSAPGSSPASWRSPPPTWSRRWKPACRSTACSRRSRPRAPGSPSIRPAIRGARDRLSHQARALMEERLAASALELLSPALAADPEWVLGLEIAGTRAAVTAEVMRATEAAEVAWSRLAPDQARTFWSEAARGPLGGETGVRLGVFPDGLDEMIDLVAERLDLGLVAAGPGCGLLRWSGTASVEALRALRGIAAEREIPLTLERAPWALRHAVGHFGAYREGVGRLVAKLRSTFDPDPTFAVALEGSEHG